ELRISDFASLGIFTLVKNPLQIAPFMQNKPNFRKSQMNVSIFSQKAYENISDWTLGKNKPNQSQLSQRDTQYAIRDTKYKPNQTQFQNLQKKLAINSYCRYN
ncbi:MAG: hypothetical protein ACYTEO_10825, partial [Planctomycetota bacterium]